MILIGGQRSCTAVRKSEAVHAAGHLDVGEQQHDVGSGFQDCDGLVGIDRLDRRVTGVFHHIDRAHAKQHFVLDDENDRGNRRMIKGHHDGPLSKVRWRKSALLKPAGSERVAQNDWQQRDKHLTALLIPIALTIVE